MKLIGRPLIAAFITIALESRLSAQATANERMLPRVEAGAFVEDLRHVQVQEPNLWGVGVRTAFQLSPHLQVEAEGAYDFVKSLNSEVSIGGLETSVQYQRSQVRLIEALVGPKLNLALLSAFQPYVTVKGGLVNRSQQKQVIAQLMQIPNADTRALIYPAGGVAVFLGRVGIRAEIGDEVSFNQGPTSSPRFAFGPEIRF